jgi:TonB-dependent receptor
MNQRLRFKKKILATAVASCALSGVSIAATAQEGVLEEVVVTGIKGSLMRSMDIKRDATGVVDAISAEDIGKFPDSNLAESLQRITGVSIDRVNGEGSEVTVRGFGGGNNLVTLNGRHMPAANVAVVGGDQNADFAQGAGRSFDFSNLASEGVRGLEVYKTGRASIPTGGIGATINIQTLRPLDQPGVEGSIGVKLVNDTTVRSGDEYTPEVSGLFSWTDDDDTFGVAVFASYQERHSATASATSNYWNITTYGAFTAEESPFVDDETQIFGAPPAPGTLVSVPNDSRWHFAETERERLNGMLTLQYRPVESLTLTADALVARNSLISERSDQTNWFNRPFDYVGFDSNPLVATTVYLAEDISGVKDTGFEQQLRGTEDSLNSFGFNADWQVNDRLNLVLDAHVSEAESLPDAGGYSSVLFSMGAPVVTSHSLDWRTGFPVQQIQIDDSLRDTDGDFGGTNANGVLDAGDLGSQVARTISSAQVTEISEIRLEGSWELDFATLDFGGDLRTLEMNQARTQTQQDLGGWGIANPGDIPTDMVETFCLSCQFEDLDPRATGASQTAFRADALELYNALSPEYASRGNEVNTTNIEDNTVEEDIWAVYAQMTFEGEMFGNEWELLAGVRYEETDVTSTSLIVPAEAIIWQSDNDFTVRTSSDRSYLTQSGSYDNVLPSLDFSYNLTEDLKARASWSKTIARPGYGSLFVADNANTPPRATALGGTAAGTAGNPGLLPLESTNLDVSLEWYFEESSYVSLGYYDKKIENFLGSGVVSRNLFGLRDVSSGAPGTRSGQALEALALIGQGRNDVNLFTMTSLINNLGSVDAALEEYQANLDANGNLTQAFIEEVFQATDLEGNADDPLFDFAVQTPVNNREGNIYGWEFALQHFFGDTGFGFNANYTTVTGDVGIDVASNPDVDQFALVGLSDSANFSLIYENYGFSARLAYNWREAFLSQTNRGGDRNPVFTDDYKQVDLNVSYEFTDNFMMTLEAINLAGADTRSYGRNWSNVWMVSEQGPRYLLGARYTF